MTTQTVEQLASKRCEACEGGVNKFSPDQAREQLEALAGWQMAEDGASIFKEWSVKNFPCGIEFLKKAAELAEAEGHHPDLHLTGYRHVRIELSTHAVGGLSSNDFILAAKIDRVPVELKN